MYIYNYLNKIQTRIDTGGHIYKYEYDSLGRVTKVFNPDSTYRETQYNDALNVFTLFDENRNKKEYSFDRSGNLLIVKEYINSTEYYLTQYYYDFSGRLISTIDANGNVTTYMYDSMFGPTQIFFPDSTIETFTYDAVGNLIQKINANGTTSITYDAINQIIGFEYPDQFSITIEYDENGNRTLMADSFSMTTSSYDNRNRLISESKTIEGESYDVCYEYDDASNLLSITYPDHTIITYEYDALNRLGNIPGYAQFTYNQDSLMSNMRFSNDIITIFDYDDCHRPINICAQKDDVDLLCMNYQYDQGGNISQFDYNRRLPNQEWKQSTEIFQYDGLDRLLSAQGVYGNISYSYDPVGNRLSLNDRTFIYNNMNELLSIISGEEDCNFTYDDIGNMITRDNYTDLWAYTYNARNQLSQVKKNQQLFLQFVYDGDCKRIKKTEWIESLQEYQVIIYVYSGMEVIYEKNLNTGQEATYISGQRGKIAKRVSDLIDYYHTDHLGSIRLVTDESGNTITETTYRPFGEATISGEKDSHFYNGKEMDSSGLYYYGSRYYDPEIGRFITRDTNPGDPINPQSLNRYIYCLNNPLKYIDPLGLESEEPAEEEPKTKEEWKEFFEQLLEDGASPEDVLAFAQEVVSQYLEGLEDLMEGILEGDLEEVADQILTALATPLMIFEAFVEVIHEHNPNFEGVVVELYVSIGAKCGGVQGGISLIYSATQQRWALYKFAGGGVSVPGGSGTAGIGAFFWKGEGEFTFNNFEGFFLSGAGGYKLGMELFISGDSKITGFMILGSMGITGSGMISYYWLLWIGPYQYG